VGDACLVECDAAKPDAQLDTGRVLVNNVSLNGGSNTLAVSAGADIEITFGYILDPCTSQTPVSLFHQIVIGWSDGSSPICAYDGVCAPSIGTTIHKLRAPMQPGTYDLLVGVVQDPSCNEDWGDAPPAANHRIAAVCVQ
jgi:hypothetical protein